MANLATMAEGFTILAKYAPEGSVCAEHDEIWAGEDELAHPNVISEVDAQRLQVLGFRFDKGTQSWHHFV